MRLGEGGRRVAGVPVGPVILAEPVGGLLGAVRVQGNAEGHGALRRSLGVQVVGPAGGDLHRAVRALAHRGVRHHLALMHELTRDQFDRVSPLFTDLVLYPHLPFCVLEGRQPGRVFADDTDAPTAALVCHQIGYSYLGGGAETSARWVEKEMVEVLGLGRLSLCVAPGFWAERLPAMAGLAARPYAIHTYRLDESLRRQGLATLPPVPEGCEVQRITAPTLEHRHNECLVFFGTPEAWERHGVGYALLERGEVASACVTSFVGNGTCDTSLTTLEPFRRRGYGTQVSAALVQGCIDAGLEPIWHTTPDNVASDRIARRLGYEVLATCTMYMVRR